MTFTYTGRPGTATIAGRLDAVRFLIGDTVEAEANMQDEEIYFLLDQEADSVWGAALLGADTMKTKYADLASYSVGDLSVQYGQQVQHWESVAKSIKERVNLDVSRVYAGGISLSDKASVAGDTDWNKPYGGLGMHDNQGTGETIHGYTT
jgi:hypothetical protein